MKLTKEQVAAVVTEASQRMSDPNYSAMLVGGFVESQTPVAQFISANDRELGDPSLESPEDAAVEVLVGQEEHGSSASETGEQALS